jgi:hypothetical protein
VLYTRAYIGGYIVEYQGVLPVWPLVVVGGRPIRERVYQGEQRIEAILLLLLPLLAR